MELKMKIRYRLADIAEGLYFINHVYEKDLATILKPYPEAPKEAQS
jgi:hypothetical protein